MGEGSVNFGGTFSLGGLRPPKLTEKNAEALVYPKRFFKERSSPTPKASVLNQSFISKSHS
jgi:hypothetical protein